MQDMVLLSKNGKIKQIIYYFNLNSRCLAYKSWGNASGKYSCLVVFRQQVSGKDKSRVKAEFISPQDVSMQGIAYHQDILFGYARILLNDIFPGKHEDLGIRLAKTDELFPGYFFNHIRKTTNSNTYIPF